MKKFITILVCFFSLAWISASNPPEAFIFIGGRPPAEEASDCPAWGTYGTSTGNITFAWSGGHPSGQDYACDSSETGVDAAEVDVTFSGSGDATYAIIDASAETLAWTIDSGDVNFDAGEAYTVCIEFQISGTTGSTTIFEIESDGTDYTWIKLPDSTTYYLWWMTEDGGNNSEYVNGVSTGSWQTLAISWYQNAGNDWSVSINGGDTWSGFDKDWSAWTDAENLLVIGMSDNPTYNETIWVDSLAILKGYEQACPDDIDN